jgi:TPR repeat protein
MVKKFRPSGTLNGSKGVWVAALVALTAVVLVKYRTSEPQQAQEIVPQNKRQSGGLTKEYFKEANLSEIEYWAKKGNAEAQGSLGGCYYIGAKGAEKSIRKAIEWLTKSATQGNSGSALLLWLINEDPSTPPNLKNPDEAARWLQAAAEGGNKDAESFFGQYHLGVYGKQGDLDKAFIYLKRAAEKGNGDAIYWLGECYANGWGTDQNPRQAIHYLTMASDSDAKFAFKDIAQQKLAEAYKYGYGVTKNAKTAFEYFEKSAYLGNIASQAALVRAYFKGEGVVPNMASSLIWVYVNRASGGSFSEKLVSLMEQDFNAREISVLRNMAQEIVDHVENLKHGATATIPTPSPVNRRARSTGTGVVVSPEGLIVTAAHVVEGASKIEVCLPGGKKTAIVAKKDPINDLALLVVDETGLVAAPLSESGSVKLGQSVFTIGFPNTEIQGTSPKFTKGEISSLAGIQDEPTRWQISVPVQSGNSGSPLFDESGNVVGIVVSKLDALETAKTTGDLIQNVNYAVKNAYLMPLLDGFKIKKPSQKKRWVFKSNESVVEESKKSVVLILAY